MSKSKYEFILENIVQNLLSPLKNEILAEMLK